MKLLSFDRETISIKHTHHIKCKHREEEKKVEWDANTQRIMEKLHRVRSRNSQCFPVCDGAFCAK